MRDWPGRARSNRGGDDRSAQTGAGRSARNYRRRCRFGTGAGERSARVPCSLGFQRAAELRPGLDRSDQRGCHDPGGSAVSHPPSWKAGRDRPAAISFGFSTGGIRATGPRWRPTTSRSLIQTGRGRRASARSRARRIGMARQPRIFWRAPAPARPLHRAVLAQHFQHER